MRYGARPLRRAVRQFAEDPFAEEVLTGKLTKGCPVLADASPQGDGLRFSVSSRELPQKKAEADRAVPPEPSVPGI